MKVLLSARVLTLLSCLLVSTQAERYSIGSTSAYIDNVGNTWQADPLQSGTAHDQCPSFFGLANSELYCPYREWNQATTGTLDFPVQDGRGYYRTVLFFYENGGTEGDRVVDIYVEGELLYDNLDVHQYTGGSFYGFFYLTLTHLVLDGTVSLEIRAKTGQPRLSAIEILPVQIFPPSNPVDVAENSHINLGAVEAYTDQQGQVWNKDTLDNSGAAVDLCPEAFRFYQDQPLYCKYREWPSGDSGVLDIPVPEPGTYVTTLIFSETQETAGSRVVDIFVEGDKLWEDLDVAERLGGSMGVFTLKLTTFVYDEAVSIQLTATTGIPVLAAIGVEAADVPTPNPTPAQTPAPTTNSTPSPTTPAPTIPQTPAPITPAPTTPQTPAPKSPAPTTPAPTNPQTPAPTTSAPTNPQTPAPTTPAPTNPQTPAPATPAPTNPQTPPATPAPTKEPSMDTIRINCGSNNDYTDSEGNVWLSDRYSNIGGQYTELWQVTDAAIYGTERWFPAWVDGEKRYEIPIEKSGTYVVELHFAEIYYQEEDKRVFDVYVENTLVAGDLDLVKEAGYRTPYVKKVTLWVEDGGVSVDFIANIENPKISGIEVYSAF